MYETSEIMENQPTRADEYKQCLEVLEAKFHCSIPSLCSVPHFIAVLLMPKGMALKCCVKEVVARNAIL